MRALHCSVILALTLSACGDETPLPLAVEIAVADKALLTNVARVRVGLHSGEVACDSLALAGSSYRATYQMDIPVTSSQRSVGDTLYEIADGEYTVNAWGLGILGGVQAYGCVPDPITVTAGRQVTVSLTLQAFRGF